MSLSLIQEPSLTVDAKVSYWNEAGNPICYKFQRKDYAVGLYSNSGGFVRIQVSNKNITDQLSVGDYIYLNDVSYTGIHKVTAISFSTPHTLVTIDVTYTSGSTSGGFFNITKRTYRVQIDFYNTDNSLLFSSLQYSDNSVGVAIAFVDSVAKSFLSLENDFDYTGTDTIVEDTLFYKKLFIKYTEIIDGVSGTPVSATSIYAVYGCRQINDFTITIPDSFTADNTFLTADSTLVTADHS